MSTAANLATFSLDLLDFKTSIVTFPPKTPSGKHCFYSQ